MKIGGVVEALVKVVPSAVDARSYSVIRYGVKEDECAGLLRSVKFHCNDPKDLKLILSR
jgi:hypothetical protein